MDSGNGLIDWLICLEGGGEWWLLYWWVYAWNWIEKNLCGGNDPFLESRICKWGARETGVFQSSRNVQTEWNRRLLYARTRPTAHWDKVGHKMRERTWFSSCFVWNGGWHWKKSLTGGTQGESSGWNIWWRRSLGSQRHESICFF